jgi:hypothetical protein
MEVEAELGREAAIPPLDSIFISTGRSYFGPPLLLYNLHSCGMALMPSEGVSGVSVLQSPHFSFLLPCVWTACPLKGFVILSPML